MQVRPLETIEMPSKAWHCLGSSCGRDMLGLCRANDGRVLGACCCAVLRSR